MIWCVFVVGGAVQYNNASTSLADRYMHLTNYSVNKSSSSYTHNVDAGQCQGHKWTLKSLWGYLKVSSRDELLYVLICLVILIVTLVPVHINTLLLHRKLNVGNHCQVTRQSFLFFFFFFFLWNISFEPFQAQDVDTSALWSRVADLVIKTIISGEHDIVVRTRKNVRSR